MSRPISRDYKRSRSGGAGFDLSRWKEFAAGLGAVDLAGAIGGSTAEAFAEALRAARQLANRLLEAGFEPDEVRKLYAGLKSRISGTAERLDWADGIIALCGGRG